MPQYIILINWHTFETPLKELTSFIVNSETKEKVLEKLIGASLGIYQLRIIVIKLFLKNCSEDFHTSYAEYMKKGDPEESWETEQNFIFEHQHQILSTLQSISKEYFDIRETPVIE